MGKRSKYDKPHANECPTCEGTGVANETAGTGYFDDKAERYVTVERGSGCFTCFGTGRLAPEYARA